MDFVTLLTMFCAMFAAGWWARGRQGCEHVECDYCSALTLRTAEGEGLCRTCADDILGRECICCHQRFEGASAYEDEDVCEVCAALDPDLAADAQPHAER